MGAPVTLPKVTVGGNTLGGVGLFGDFGGFAGFGGSMVSASASSHAGNQGLYSGGSVPVAGKRHPTNPNLVADGEGGWVSADLAYSLGPKNPGIQPTPINLPPIIAPPNFDNYPTVNISMADVANVALQGARSFTVGGVDAVIGTIQSTLNTIQHPVQTFQGTADTLGSFAGLLSTPQGRADIRGDLNALINTPEGAQRLSHGVGGLTITVVGMIATGGGQAPEMLGPPGSVGELVTTVGTRGRSANTRILNTEGAMEDFYKYASRNGRPINVGNGGTAVILEDGTFVGYRPTSLSGGPAVDVKLPSGQVRKLHYEPIEP